MFSVTVLLSTLELLRFPQALPSWEACWSAGFEHFLYFRSLPFRSGSISRLRRFVKRFWDHFLAILSISFLLFPSPSWPQDRSSPTDSHNRLRSLLQRKERSCQRKLHLSGKTPKRRHQIGVPLRHSIRRTSDEISRRIVSQTDRLVKSL